MTDFGATRGSASEKAARPSPRGGRADRRRPAEGSARLVEDPLAAGLDLGPAAGAGVAVRDVEAEAHLRAARIDRAAGARRDVELDLVRAVLAGRLAAVAREDLKRVIRVVLEGDA